MKKKISIITIIALIIMIVGTFILYQEYKMVKENPMCKVNLQDSVSKNNVSLIKIGLYKSEFDMLPIDEYKINLKK